MITDFERPRTVSLFCGAGGESAGKDLAFRQLGLDPAQMVNYAVNHWGTAVHCHQINFPFVEARKEDITEVTAEDFDLDRIDLLWASPSCVHFSRSRGGLPKSNQQRSHATEVVDRWLRVANTGVCLFENVQEFSTWGPLHPADHPIEKLRNQPIKERAGEYFRQFVADLHSLGYRTEWRVLCCADYGDPTMRKRFFMIAEKDGYGIRWPEPTHRDVRKPATPTNAHLPAWRSAAECIDWSLPMCSIFATKEEAKAFARQHGYKMPPRRPLAENTLKRIARGIEKFVMNGSPFIVDMNDMKAAPTLIQTGFGERPGQAPRCLDLNLPLGTVVAGGPKHALVAAFLAKHYTGVTGTSLEQPIGTITGVDHHSLVAVTLVTNTSGHGPTDLRAPMPTLTTGNHHALVAAFLTKYHRDGGQWQSLHEPLHTITTKDEYGLVTVELDGETYAIVDIAMRMLKAHELSAAMSFPADYQWLDEEGQMLDEDDIVKMIGNAVPVRTVSELVKCVVQDRPHVFRGGSNPPCLSEVVNG